MVAVAGVMVAVARVMEVVDAMPEAGAKASPHDRNPTDRSSGAGASSSGVGSGNADARRGKGYQ
eukprot:6089067-Pleurochrysis_carterae.AAC.1